MRSTRSRSWPFLVLLLALGTAAAPAVADEREEETLNELVTRLLAEVRMLADKVERLDARIAGLEARRSAPPPSPAAATEPTPSTPVPTLSAPTPVAAPTQVAGPATPAGGPAGGALRAFGSLPSGLRPPSDEVGSLPSGETHVADVTSLETPAAGAPLALAEAEIAQRLPAKRHFEHRQSIGSTYVEAFDKTLVRMQPFPVETSVQDVDLLVGAVLSYPGKVASGIPQSMSLDMSSTWDGWNAYSDRAVSLYVDNKRYDLGPASFRQETRPDGTRVTTFTISVPRPVLLALVAGADVVGTLGQLEFPIPTAGLEALRDLASRMAPDGGGAGAGASAPAAAAVRAAPVGGVGASR